MAIADTILTLLSVFLAAFISGLFIGSQAQKAYMKNLYCQHLGAEYYSIKENGVCIFPNGKAEDITIFNIH